MMISFVDLSETTRTELSCQSKRESVQRGYTFYHLLFTELELIGKFSTETHNVSLVGHEIFNFSTNQFEYISTIETYNLKTKEFKVVWEKETEEFDFSPYQPIACFPLVVF